MLVDLLEEVWVALAEARDVEASEGIASASSMVGLTGLLSDNRHVLKAIADGAPGDEDVEQAYRAFMHSYRIEDLTARIVDAREHGLAGGLDPELAALGWMAERLVTQSLEREPDQVLDTIITIVAKCIYSGSGPAAGAQSGARRMRQADLAADTSTEKLASGGDSDAEPLERANVRAPAPARHHRAQHPRDVGPRTDQSAGVSCRRFASYADQARAFGRHPLEEAIRAPMTTKEKVDAFLAEPRNVMVAGIRRDGRPHVTPNRFYWDGERFFVSTTRSRVKYAIFRRDPRAELVVDDSTDSEPSC